MPYDMSFFAVVGVVVTGVVVLLVAGLIVWIVRDFFAYQRGARLTRDYLYLGEDQNQWVWTKWVHEFKILDIQEGDGNRAGMAARVVLVFDDGRTFSAGVIGNFEYCKQLLADKDLHIGKMGTVVFQNYTPAGIPRFPKFKCVRWDV